MADLFKSIVEQVVSKSFNAAMTKERQREIAMIGKSWDYYYVEQERYIRQYEGERDRDYQDKDKPTFNYTKLIVDEYVGGVFGKPVRVSFPDKADTDRWNEIISPISFTNQVPFMKRVQRVAEVSETAVVMVRYDSSKGRPYFEDIRGEFVRFLPKENNPKEVGVLVISYVYDTGIPDPKMRFMERIELWSEEKWEVWVHAPALNDSKLVESGDNPYGVIPATIYKPEDDDNSFYGRSNTKDVVVINETYNNLWTALMRISVMQSFSILVITSENQIKIEVAPTRYIKLPETEKGSASYITPSAKISEVREVLLSLKEDLQDFSRVPASVFSSSASKGAPQSGYALKIKRIPIEEVWENRRQSYGPAYAHMAALALHVDAIHQGKDKSIYLETIPEVDFTSTAPGLSPQEQLIQDQFDLRYNLITPIDMYLKKHPGLTREEAIQKLDENQKINSQFGTTFAPLQVQPTGVLANILQSEKSQSQTPPQDQNVDTPQTTSGQ
jgi:hypothetical protein